MTQTQGHGQKPAPAPTLGAAAAAAATNGSTPHADNKPDTKDADRVAGPADADPASVKPAKPAKKKAADMTEAEKAAAKAERLAKSKKVLIVVGTVHEFETAAKAEKFLNGSDAPQEYTAYRGLRIGTNKKVSLR